ncbi:hypothetical protein AX289_27535 [Methylorubrum populi]|nr:hypothetical protein AX289_27535 [Methylorubrum populi]
MADKRSKILDRIRLLRNMTVDRGCTEAEAVEAAAKVARLLAENDLTLDEVEIRSTPFSREDASLEADIGERIWAVAEAIAHLTDCRCWSSATGVVPVRISFFGLAHESEIAAYLLAICSRAMRDDLSRAAREWALYRPNVQRRRRGAFLDGMADSLSRRIRALKPPGPPGQGLVVLKDALIDAELENLGMKFRDLRVRRPNDLDDSYVEGVAAGEQVPLDPGLRPPERTAGLVASGGR